LSEDIIKTTPFLFFLELYSARLVSVRPFSTIPFQEKESTLCRAPVPVAEVRRKVAVGRVEQLRIKDAKPASSLRIRGGLLQMRNGVVIRGRFLEPKELKAPVR
jgi:hypothetical protein